MSIHCSLLESARSIQYAVADTSDKADAQLHLQLILLFAVQSTILHLSYLFFPVNVYNSAFRNLSKTKIEQKFTLTY